MSNYSDHMRAMFWPYKGHIRAMFWSFLLYLCFYIPKIAQIFTEDSCLSCRRLSFNVKLLGLYKGHVWAILGPYLSYFYNIFACRCLKWLKFSLKCHLYQIEEYFEVTLFGPYWSHLGHIKALFWLFL